ncbi:hypothetical protein GOALK_072_01690 [Gordonia alkanivorans NBRC 16433]|uniref:Uncharacterized protein n=2 Tax=Gordonia alkanivorans TaxID=84096 RepID=F9VXM7_9ACTN|nr:hypothetical protein GOALK_072_01690 [Gordonia alkanivorans NBRC 16433]
MIEDHLDGSLTLLEWVTLGHDLHPSQKRMRHQTRHGSQLKAAFLARFALAFAGQLEHHASESLSRARDFGATYTEMGSAIGMTRQGVRRRWGITPEVHNRALNTIAQAVEDLQSKNNDPALRWKATPIAHTYDPEATLSAALIEEVDGTDRPVRQILIFRDGRYIGPAVDRNLKSLCLAVSVSRATQVAIEARDLKYDADDDLRKSTIYTARLMLKGDKLRWSGELPEGVASPIAQCGWADDDDPNSRHHHSP